MKAIFAILFAALLSGCGSLGVISNAPAGGLVTADSVVGKDLKAATSNVDKAVAIGVLDVNDPAAYCLHSILKDACLEGACATPPASFEPDVSGVVSAASVAYIRVQQLKKLRAQAKPVDPACEAVVGRIVIDAAKATGKAVTPSIGGMLLR